MRYSNPPSCTNKCFHRVHDSLVMDRLVSIRYFFRQFTYHLIQWRYEVKDIDMSLNKSPIGTLTQSCTFRDSCHGFYTWFFCQLKVMIATLRILLLSTSLQTQREESPHQSSFHQLSVRTDLFIKGVFRVGFIP